MTGRDLVMLDDVSRLEDRKWYLVSITAKLTVPRPVSNHEMSPEFRGPVERPCYASF